MRRGLSFILLTLLVFSASGCGIFFHAGGPKPVTKKMLVTGYDAGQKSCGWRYKWGCFLLPAVYAYGPHEGERKIVGVTSDGTKAKHGTIAADVSRYPYGTRMHVPGYGWGVVHDTGSAIKGDHIDVFFEDEDDAQEWGRQWLKVIIEKPE
ncbi:MAG: 3D domain-containing protein [Smithellaceae bacterium]|nr:3D domain-containing protein [Smithellaceae bacterium]